MKLSNELITILQNFSTINQSILFKEGNVIRTMSPQKTIMASATVPDDFPRLVGIYNLPRFLSVYGLYENPSIEFGANSLSIVEGNRRAKYVYADPSMIISPPEKEINLPSADVSVTLTATDLAAIKKAASVFQLPEIAFIGEDGICYIRAIDSANPAADSYSIELGTTDDTFTLIIKTEHLVLLPADYKVELAAAGISKFESDKVTYFIAIESKSSTYKKG